MTQTCAYCDTEHDVSETVYTRITHGFGHANKETLKFCSVECRTWWRRRESDQSGAWEQPAPAGYQARLDRFRDGHDDRSESVSAAVEARSTSDPATGQKATV